MTDGTWVHLQNGMIIKVRVTSPEILDWEGIYDANGNPIPFSEENKKRLTSEDNPFGRMLLLTLALNLIDTTSKNKEDNLKI